MSKQNNYKVPLSIFGIYEVFMILILSFDDLCDSILCMFSGWHCDFCDYDGLQYVIMCLLIPVIFGIIWWWRLEIKNGVNTVRKNNKKRREALYNQLLEEELARRKKGETSKKPTYGWQQWE